jgi:tight adherence protein C
LKSKIKKLMEKNKTEIVKSLPSFINQLLLLMNSGMVLNEAFCKVAQGYGQLTPKRQNYFTVQVYNIYESSQQNGENVIQNFYKFGRTSNVKELARVSGILIENQNRGTDLWDKLCEQSESLWDERKRTAMKEIRMSESKMSFPLGILLMALIIITAAPAMLQI